MIDILNRATVTIGEATWEYHRDTSNPAVFYITPQPMWLTVNGLPSIQVVEYSADGAGYCTLQVQLSVPDAVVSAVTSDIAQRYGVQTPEFLTLPFQSGTVVTLTYPDGQGGTTDLQADGTDFGGNQAIFNVPLDATQMTTIKAMLTTAGGCPFEVQYSIIVQAVMPGVTVTLSFDSATAFQYQVTAHEHTHWARSSSYTYDITEQLSESASTNVTVTKIDPNIADDVISALQTWGETIIESLVQQEVTQALGLQQGASGTQPFDVSQLASFNQSYAQNETIQWRLQPQVTLPSFADLGLTTAQIASLEATVDNRQFVAQLTPQCNFANSGNVTPNPSIKQGPSQFTSMPLSKLDVTISYPTLASSPDRTHTFTDNTPFTWQAAWDLTAGGSYSLSWVATYSDEMPQVSGAANVDVSAYTLELADIGTLNVVFDASNIFTDKNNVVDHVDIEFVFNIPGQKPWLQTPTLNAQTPQHTFTNVFPAPLTADYLYILTYSFLASVQANAYTSDAKSRNGPYVRVETPAYQQPITVTIIHPTGASALSSATFDVYYESEPSFPAIPASNDLPKPTQASPIRLTLPRTGKGNKWSDSFTVFANSQLSPLTLTGMMIGSTGATNVGPFDFNPVSVQAIPIGPSYQYLILCVDPAIVDWTTSPLTGGVVVNITAVRYTVPGQTAPQTYGSYLATQTTALTTGATVAPKLFFPVLGLPAGFTNVEFDWSAGYVYASGELWTSGTTQGNVLKLPTSATNTSPPPGTAAIALSE